MRKLPTAFRVARWYCRRSQQTFSLLPDFLASQVPGTLVEIEQAAEAADGARSLEQAAAELRPAEAEDAVSLPSALRWLQRRHRWVHTTLVIAVTVLPELSGCPPTLAAVRARLGTEQALQQVRHQGLRYLRTLPAPVGFGRQPRARSRRTKSFQHGMGPDPPREA